jgi:hypothetical protein
MRYSTLHPHSEAEWADRESDKKVVRDLLCCAHCGLHFYVTPGSGKRRGFCARCGDVTCGAEKCQECVHWRKKLELIEAGKADMSLISTGRAEGLPVSVAIPVAGPGERKSKGGIILAE